MLGHWPVGSLFHNFYRHGSHTLIDNHYVDASKLVDQAIPAVKAQFNYWFDKCAWHRPSVLVLDNLDKLLPAEVEVSFVKNNLRYSCIINLCSMQIHSGQDTSQRFSWACLHQAPIRNPSTLEESCSLRPWIQRRLSTHLSIVHTSSRR